MLRNCAHLCPWKLRMLLEEVRCGAVDLGHDLPNDLNIAHNGVLNLLVVLKGFPVRYGLK